MTSARASNLLISFAVAVLLTACKLTEQVTDTQRRESVQGLTTRSVDGIRLDDYLAQRTAVLLCGSMVASSARATGQSISVEFQGAPNTVLAGPANAVAIAGDGYFLTAAHCLHKGYLNYLVYSDVSCAKIAAARTVDRVWDQNKGLDWAILHVDAGLPYVFDWARAEDTTVGTSLAAMGHSTLSRTGELSCFLSHMFIGGRVVGTPRPRGDFWEVRSDLPLRKGDSGGPAVTVEGKLVGINVLKHVGPIRSFSLSVRPDSAWLERVIQEDRRRSTDAGLPQVPETSQATNAPLVVVISVASAGDGSTRGNP